MAFLRKLAAILCVLVLAAVPVMAGGDGGLVNLPGGGGRSCKEVVPTGNGITLVLPAEMRGAVAYIQGNPSGGSTLVNTTNGALYISAETINKLTRAGASSLRITFVAPSGETMIVTVEFDAEEQTATITVYP